MFKGLRTKIESEKGRETQTSQTSRNTPATNDNNTKNFNPNISKSDPHNLEHTTVAREDILEIKKNISSSNNLVQSHTNESKVRPTTDPSTELGAQGATIGQLREQVSLLTQQLEDANREKEIGNEQNAQLYQLIEKLRRNLESEKETNSSLQTKLEQTELALKEKTDLIESLENTTENISPFAPKDKFNHHVPVTMRDLQLKVSQLQTQLSEKNRQLKVCNQTTNDIRKALQQEVSEHNKTRETFNKLQIDLKELKEDRIESSNVHDGSALQSDIDGNHRENSLIPTITANETHDINKQPYYVPNLDKDEKGLYVDKISIQSKSSASVHDFDSNDLSTNINSKDVNHEYLRNVLFRYMTSSDKETMQHLVKAISVMMNFTPEQSVAIKSAMNSRLSWLRLK